MKNDKNKHITDGEKILDRKKSGFSAFAWRAKNWKYQYLGSANGLLLRIYGLVKCMFERSL